MHSPAFARSVTIVTPSFNQARFLSSGLASVRDQSSPPVEHLVYDPGSHDDSREIAASFPHVTLMAEPDDGQSHALNKGFSRAKGDIIAWLNADDKFAHENVLQRVLDRFRQHDAPDIVYGRGTYTDESGNKLRDAYVNRSPDTLAWRLHEEVGILQPAVFMQRSVFQRVGLLRENLHFAMDYDYWIRCIKEGLKFAFLDDELAGATLHAAGKTVSTRGSSYAEICDVVKAHFGYVHHKWLRRYAEFLADGHDGIITTAASGGVTSARFLEERYRDLLVAYNTDFDTHRTLQLRSGEKGYGETLREIGNCDLAPADRCKPVAADQKSEPGHVCYTVGPRRWAFRADWKAAEIAATHTFLRARIRDRRRDTCVVVGNGPSLNRTDLTLLEGQDVIISNNAFLNETLRRVATYFTVVNYLVAEQSNHHINLLRGIAKVVPYWLSYCLSPGTDTHFVDAVGHAEFSRDIFKNMSWRHTVTFFNLHLAYGLGYRKVVMIGFDHTYKQAVGTTEATIVHSEKADENHFDPSYFRGKKWQAADVDMMEAMYRLAQDAFTSDGRTIVNATEGGNLELFPRESLAQALSLQ